MNRAESPPPEVIYKELRTKLAESCELAKEAPELNELLDTVVDICCGAGEARTQV